MQAMSTDGAPYVTGIAGLRIVPGNRGVGL
jgi:hypothetical protein